MNDADTRAIVLFVLSARHCRTMGFPRENADRYFPMGRFDEMRDLGVDPDAIIDEVYKQVPLPV